MRDKLENFVIEHLDQFDTAIPNEKIWCEVESRLDAVSTVEDSLEEFVFQNKNKFNTELPSHELWSQIDQRIAPSPRIRKFNFIRLAGIAASVVALLFVGAAAGIYISQNNSEDPIAEVTIIEETPSEILELEKFYQKQVDKKHTQLASYNYDSTVNDDLSQLDETLKELREELKNAPEGNESQIINAMVQNYKTKIKILEIVLSKIKTSDQKKENRNSETIM